MKIGIVTDGKYGDRAYDNIRQRFSTEWILIETPSIAVIDDMNLDIPICDLYISYVRHPDVVLELLKKGVPTILGISFGLGFQRQATEINRQTLVPITMCSLEDNTGIKEFDAYAKFFGRPKFELDLTNDVIASIRVLRGSPCGSTFGAADDIVGRKISRELFQYFGLRVCHYCRAPRFGRTCDKEFSGILHARELIHSIFESNIDMDRQSILSAYAKEIEDAYVKHIATSR